MNESQDKMIKTSKKVNVALNILFFLSILSILTVVAFYLLYGFGNDELRNDIISKLYTNGHAKLDDVSFQLVFFAFLLMIIDASIWAFIFYQLIKTFNNIIEKKTPFILNNIKRIRNIAYATFVLSIVRTCSSAFENYLLFKDFYINVDVFAILIAICIYFISLVFKYGVELQQLSDETL